MTNKHKGPGFTEMVGRLVVAYAWARPELVRDVEYACLSSLKWYRDERLKLQRIALDLEITPSRLIGAAAILSPLQNWDDLVKDRLYDWARAAIQGVPLEKNPHGGTTRANSEKAREWLTAPHHGSHLGLFGKGLKVRAFYAALMGDESSVVVDRWTARVCGWAPEAITKRRYRMIEEAHYSAAAALGVAPCDLQARLWVWLRDYRKGILPQWEGTEFFDNDGHGVEQRPCEEFA